MMTKTDKSIHSICIAAIKRHAMAPFDFRWTEYHEDEKKFSDKYAHMPVVLESGELPICSTIIDAENWSILTSRRLISMLKAELHAGYVDNSKNVSFGNYKDLKRYGTIGSLKLANNEIIEYHIETGKASMVMIYGIRTRIRMRVGDTKPIADC
jgi:hypothetical protein